MAMLLDEVESGPVGLLAGSEVVEATMVLTLPVSVTDEVETVVGALLSVASRRASDLVQIN